MCVARGPRPVFLASVYTTAPGIMTDARTAGDVSLSDVIPVDLKAKLQTALGGHNGLLKEVEAACHYCTDTFNADPIGVSTSARAYKDVKEFAQKGGSLLFCCSRPCTY